MKISLDWLSDFITWTEKDPLTIAQRLTASMGEIDDVERQGALLEHCCVGKVTTVRKHPNADTLSLCDVETEQGVKRVVCGGTNLSENMLVAFAHVGATVKWHGDEIMTLTSVKIRGEQSDGMICAAQELGIESMFPPKPEDGQRPIVDLTPLQATVGTPLRQCLGLNDVILHIDNHAITNRPDLFSHVGVARECVALNLGVWKERKKAANLIFTKKALPMRCINDIPELIPRYNACAIDIENIGNTPDWMKKRLEATGNRSINLPIDITNYVCLETGMPLHSFDADDIQGNIHMRTTVAGEKIQTLDGVERTLPAGAIVMSDDAGIFDLLGIMGGLRSSTKATTTHIYLHSPHVLPLPIRKTVIATGLRTDAATIYEKGIPMCASERGFVRAVQLLIQLAPHAIISSKREQWGKSETMKAISLSVQKVNTVLGTELHAADMKKILTNLECAITQKSPKSKKNKDESILSVTPPPHRSEDLKEAHDLIEEIGRIHGYDRIKPMMPTAPVTLPEHDARIEKLRDVLKERKYTEHISLAFASPALLKKWGMDKSQDLVKIENPLGEEWSFMRPSIMPKLAEAAEQMLRESKDALKLYEYGHVFHAHEEKTELCMIVATKAKTSLQKLPLLTAKQDLSLALSAIGYDIEYVQQTDPSVFMHPGRSATIICEKQAIGTLFEVQPIMAEEIRLSARTAIVIIDWSTLVTIKPQTRIFNPLPVFPAIKYDETFPLSAYKNHEEMLVQLRTQFSLLEKIDILDLYEQNTERNVTLRFTYRDNNRTLEQRETDAMHAKVLQWLTAQKNTSMTEQSSTIFSQPKNT